MKSLWDRWRYVGNGRIIIDRRVDYQHLYRIDAFVPVTVHVAMDPDSDDSEVVISLLDGDGELIETYDDDVPGTTVSASFEMGFGDVYFLSVTVEAADTNYLLDVIGD